MGQGSVDRTSVSWNNLNDCPTEPQLRGTYANVLIQGLDDNAVEGSCPVTHFSTYTGYTSSASVAGCCCISGNTVGDASLDKMAKAEGKEETGSSVCRATPAPNLTCPKKLRPNSLIITAAAGERNEY